MREILFRGKRMYNGEWVYGYYCKAEMLNHGGTEHFIIEYSCDGLQYYIDPSTMGQYTGLTDKNGVKIFEEDIFCCPSWPKDKYIVTWEDGGFNVFTDDCGFDPAKIEVIGNIHDNPELLKGGDGNG